MFQFLMFRIRVSIRLAIMDSIPGERLDQCLECGYDLRGTSDRQCPECGANVVVPRAE